MNAEDHLRRMVGDLVVTIARLSADIDTLRGQIPKPEPPAPVASTSGTSDNESGVSP